MTRNAEDAAAFAQRLRETQYGGNYTYSPPRAPGSPEDPILGPVGKREASTYEILVKRGRAPMWENGPDAPVVTGLDPSRRQLLVTSTLDAAPDHRYDVHGNSIVPFALAMVTGCGFTAGGVFHPVFAPIAAGLATVGLFVWFWTSGTRKPPTGAKPTEGGES